MIPNNSQQSVPHAPYVTEGPTVPDPSQTQWQHPPAQPQYFYPPQPRQSGSSFWGLGFLWFIPVVGVFIAPIVLIISAMRHRRNPDPLVRENARWASNWVATVSIVAALGVALVAASMITHLALGGTATSGTETSVLLVVANTLLWLSWLSHLVVSIVGVASARTRVVNPRIAIPIIPAAKWVSYS